MPTERIVALELDPTWKTGIEWKLDMLMAFAFPQIHILINWAIPPVPLDTELQKVAPENERGQLTADKLFKVTLRSGGESVIYVHIEIQGQRDGSFEFRMWTYNYRLCDRFGPNVISLAVLVDEDPKWRPGAYRFDFGGCVRIFEFPIFKLWDWLNPEELFDQTGNPFALIAAATQAAWRTRKDMAARGRERMRLVKYLYRKGLAKEDVRMLFRLIGWLTRLPDELELKFREDLAGYEEKEKPMTVETLLSPYELIMQERCHQEGLEEGFQKGRQEGRLQASQDAVLDFLEARFGAVPAEVAHVIRNLTDESKLRQASKLAATTSSFADFLTRS